VRLRHERLDAARPECGVPARVRGQVVDARDLEPDEVGGVVGDALRVCLREADAYVGREAEGCHESTLRSCR
jgi:hypothetical protein